MMSWVELAFETTPLQAESISERLFHLGALAVTFYDQGDNPILEPNPGETPLWGKVRCVGLFEKDTKFLALKKALAATLETPITEKLISDQNWVDSFKEHFKPMQFGPNLWICPTNTAPTAQDAITVTLEPGLAFGTGTHPTTKLCLEWLAKHPPKLLTVIDYGCGSGILALAALALGAKTVLAVDHDPQAITSTQNNLKLNNKSDPLKTYLPQDLPKISSDLILANILANPLITLAPIFADLIKTDGTILLTGILEGQQEAILKAYAPWFSFMPIIRLQEWVLLVGTRKTSQAQDVIQTPISDSEVRHD
ncbi:MAG TPA: 50S ribosomal protein L11 methyltransferase [Gammaproteobacteria bacterium]|nr:50S ribosomal protein L11 methyltransferase [Gammaproteobacteria bacterium]